MEVKVQREKFGVWMGSLCHYASVHYMAHSCRSETSDSARRIEHLHWFFFSDEIVFPMLPILGTWILDRAFRPTNTIGIHIKMKTRNPVRRVGVKSWYRLKMPPLVVGAVDEDGCGCWRGEIWRRE